MCRFCLNSECAFANPPGVTKCAQCGWEKPKHQAKPIQIHSDELRAVYAGENTPDDAQDTELRRLCAVAEHSGYAYGWVSKQFQRLFGTPPDPLKVPVSTKKREYERLSEYGAKQGFKPGFAFARYKGVFGETPRF